jgi:hypothetical protein
MSRERGTAEPQRAEILIPLVDPGENLARPRRVTLVNCLYGGGEMVSASRRCGALGQHHGLRRRQVERQCVKDSGADGADALQQIGRPCQFWAGDAQRSFIRLEGAGPHLNQCIWIAALQRDCARKAVS